MAFLDSFYDEATYLANNPDVAVAVRDRVFSSGLEHFLDFGLAEGRESARAFFHKGFYLKENPDVKAAIQNGAFQSGWQHYVLYGADEGRAPNNLADRLEEGFYLTTNPDVADAVTARAFDSAFQHFFHHGFAEGRRGAPEVRHILVMIVDLIDAKASSLYTLEQLDEITFSDPRSVAEIFRRASFGNLIFRGDVVGPFAINSRAKDCVYSDFTDWANLADVRATASGIDLSSYQHIMYVFAGTDLIRCAPSGLAEQHGRRTWIFDANDRAITCQELGHNLGMHHAGIDPNNDGVTDAVYGDMSDFMGGDRKGGMVNGAHVAKMKWYNTWPSTQPSLILSSGTYDIATMSIAEPGDRLPIVLKIKGPLRWYYLSYRQRRNFDSHLPTKYTKGVSVHRAGGYRDSDTGWITTLADGEIFEDSGAGVMVTQLTHSPELVTVRVTV